MVQDFNARMQERQGTDQSSLHSKQTPGHPRPALYQKVLKQNLVSKKPKH